MHMHNYIYFLILIYHNSRVSFCITNDPHTKYGVHENVVCEGASVHEGSWHMRDGHGWTQAHSHGYVAVMALLGHHQCRVLTK